MKMAPRISLLLFLLGATFLSTPAVSSGWPDLDEDEHKVFGSEKERKYSINAFFIEKEEWENHRSFMLLWLYKTVDYPKYTSLRVLPFWYRLQSKIDDRRKTFIPILLYYGELEQGDTVSLSPVHYFSHKPGWSEKTWCVPIVPLFYRATHAGGGHQNIFWLIDYSWRRYDDGERLGRLWLIPLWFYKPGADGYTHILPPLFLNNRSSNGESYTHLLPLFVRWKDIDYEYAADEEGSGSYHTLYTKALLNPLYCSVTATGEEKGWSGEPIRSRLWFPLVPLYYTGVDRERGRHTNVLWLFDWQRDSRGGLNRFWFFPFYFAKKDEYQYIFTPLYVRTATKSSHASVTPLWYYRLKTAGEGRVAEKTLWVPLLPLLYASSSDEEGSRRRVLLLLSWESGAEGKSGSFELIPFVFHQFGPSGYRYYFPFYMKPAGWSDERGLSYGLFHYNRWSPDGHTRWSWLVHYSHSAPSLEREINLWAPVYLYTRSQASSFTLFLPLYFNYEDKQRSLHVNILGLSKSVVSGMQPAFTVGIGMKESRWYVDTDVSWLYDAASLSTRITLKKPFSESMEGIEGAGKLSRVTLQDKKTVGRESSEYFWGFTLLYGLTAFEAADSRRHFRLLPLSWITWDKASDDKLTWVLTYLSYRSGETRYFVFFPFYGMQREGLSFRRGYLLNLYWDEYRHEEDLRERTVLWPIANWYTSPRKSGWRVFPLIWHTERRQDDIDTSRTISPFYYGTVTRRHGGEAASSSVSLSLFHYHREARDSRGARETSFSPIVPIAFFSSSSSVAEAPSLQPSEAGLSEEARPSDSRRTSFVIPLYFRTETSFLSPAQGTDIRELTLVGLPLLYYHRVSAGPSLEADRTTSLFLMGYYRYESAREKQNSMLGGLWRYRRLEGKEYDFSLLYWLYAGRNIGGTHRSWLFPVYSYSRTAGERRFRLLLGLYSVGAGPSADDSSTTALYGLYHTSLRHGTPPAGGETSPRAVVRTSWLFPVYYYQNRGSGGDVERTHCSPLHYRYVSVHGADGVAESTSWFPLVPLTYFHDTGQRRHVNLLGFFDRMKDAERREERLWVLPFYFSWAAPGESIRFLLGLYLHRSPEYNRENFLYLYDHELYRAESRESRAFLLGTVHYEISPELKQFRLLYGALLDYSRARAGSDYSFSLATILYQQSRTGERFVSNLTPLWYYKNEAARWSALVPLLLSYVRDGEDQGALQVLGLGALWYRNYRPRESKDRQMLLLGIPYYTVQRAERGYRSAGSLWGLLWEWETESDTNFSKFTLLKFVYKRVNMNGEVYHRLLGIRF